MSKLHDKLDRIIDLLTQLVLNQNSHTTIYTQPDPNTTPADCAICGKWHREQRQMGNIVGDCACQCHMVMC